MKIKQVCEATGLTDRAIRYYIEEGLAAPAYTENYMGRRAYDFTEEDVAKLENLATLRKFGFSIEQIRVLLKDPVEGRLMIEDIVRDKKAALDSESEALQALEKLPFSTYTAEELADWLRLMNYKEKKPPQAEPDWDDRLGKLMICAFWLVMAVLPVGYFIGTWIDHAYNERYASVSGWGWVMLLVTLLPTLVLLTLGARKVCGLAKPGRRLLAALLVGCVLWQPVSRACADHIFGMSETTDIKHYMDLDVGCNLHWSNELEIFPHFAHEYSDPVYYYRHDASMLMYDVYAEWETYDDEELRSEIARAEELFASGKYGFHFANGMFRMQTDNWQLIMCVEPMQVTPDSEPNAPFRQMTKQYYNYTIFAWNEETGRVRYCHGEYFFGPTPCEPYYLSLEW